MRTVIRKVPVLAEQGAGSLDKGVLVQVAQVRVAQVRVVRVRGDPRRPVPGRVVRQVQEVPDLHGQIRIQARIKRQSKAVLLPISPSHEAPVVLAVRVHRERPEVLRRAQVVQAVLADQPSPVRLPRRRVLAVRDHAVRVNLPASLVLDQEGMTGSRVELPHTNQSLDLRSLRAADVNRLF